MMGIEYPIFLAGMGQLAGSVDDAAAGGSATPRLVAAVSNAGGFGVLGATGLFPDELREQLLEVKSLTDKPFGADLLLPHSKMQVPPGLSIEEIRAQMIPAEYDDFVGKMKDDLDIPEPSGPSVLANFAKGLNEDTARQQVEVCLEEGVALMASALGMPEWLPPMCHEAGTMVLGLAGSVRAALRHQAAGADVIVAQGHDAGGHTGKIGTLSLVPQVADAVAPVPVLAAGGIGDGRGVAASLTLGALGVWVGTYFLFAHEAGASPLLAKALAEATGEDVVVSRVISGKTARMLRNSVIDYWNSADLDPLPMPLQSWLMADVMQGCLDSERPDLIVGAAGQAVGMLDETKSAQELFDDLVDGTIKALEESATSVS